MNPDLRILKLEDFQELIDQDFAVSYEEGGEPQTVFTLRKVESNGQGRDGFRDPFSLFFDGPPDLPLPQHIYWLTHEKLGTEMIFLVPISGNADQRVYQAAFN